MAIKIIKLPKKVSKRCICKHCGAELEYTPNDVTYKTVRDYGGGSDRYAEFTCPNCNKNLQILDNY
jgi:RNase P subunit RPR2